MNGSISRRIRRSLCKLLILCLILPGAAMATNVEDSLTLGIVSTKTTSLNPLQPVERDFASLFDICYDGLIAINDDYLPEGDLVERWEESNAGKTWTFHLREGVTFSNGQPLTAQDVVATTQYILDMANDETAENKGYYANLKYFVSSIKAIDDMTVQIKAERAYYGLLYALNYPILPAGYAGTENPPGTGAYIFSTFEPQDYVYLQANPNWWQTPPQVEEIMVICHQSAKDLLSSYEYARVDTMFTRSTAAAQYKSGTSAVSIDSRSRQLEVLFMNHNEQALKSVNVRKAIRHAVNVDQIANQIYMGMVSKTNTPMISGTWIYNANPSDYAYDVEKAKALLKEDGWVDLDDDGVLDRVVAGKEKPQRLHLRIYVYEEPDNDVRMETANAIKDMLEEIGMSVTVTTMTFSETAEKLQAKSFDLVLCSVNMDPVPDPGFLLMRGNTMNYGSYNSKKMNELFTTLRKQSSQSGYGQTLMEIQAQFAEDCPFLCLFYRNGAVLSRKMYTVARDIRELELLRGIEDFGR
ncbi:MAG: ABC transporter substrate-binding protein [Clostridia bacterium]|nr:ABC transporter substrate-binding protein [Clostridia bacterium]